MVTRYASSHSSNHPSPSRINRFDNEGTQLSLLADLGRVCGAVWHRGSVVLAGGGCAGVVWVSAVGGGLVRNLMLHGVAVCEALAGG